MKKLALLIAIALLLPFGAFAMPSAPSAQASAGVVAASGTRLVRPDGRSLFMLGTNYVGGPDRSWTMWQDGQFDAGFVDFHFNKARSTGSNTVRIFVRSPLNQEIVANQWTKLDAVIGLAEKYGLYLIVTLYDYNDDNLANVAAVDKAIAARYAGRSIILGYDLKNEPHYQNLAVAQYGSAPPLQTNALIKSYGQKMTQQEADAWRQTEDGRALIPARFSSQQAYIYANNYRIYMQFLKEAGDWVIARYYDVSVLDYIDSPDSAKWRPLLDVLDQTLAAWLKPQIDAIRSADSGHLITVGYSDFILARLSANNNLGFVSIHRYPNDGLKPLQVAFDIFDDVRRAFPVKPIFLGEFGYTNAGASTTATTPYESALILEAMSEGMAGAAKWSMYDVAQGFDPRQMNYGIYRTDGSAKPVAYALRALGEYISAGAPGSGQLTVQANPGNNGLGYVYAAPNALFVAAPTYADSAGRLSFEASANTGVFLSWARGNQISIAATGEAKLHVKPSALLGVSAVQNLRLVSEDGLDVPFETRENTISFDVAAGEVYHLSFTFSALDARVEIVWPQGGKPVTQADKANIGAYLFERGTLKAMCPQSAPTVRLWCALDNGTDEAVGTATARSVTVGGLTFKVWEFNDVDVSAARDKQRKYFFRLAVDGSAYRSSIWSHGSDARTYLPNPEVPKGLAATAPDKVDAKIQIVWPHDNLPVDKATMVNIGAAIFKRGTLQSVPAGWSPTVRLWRSLNNGYEEEVAVGEKVMKKVGNVTYPTWQFNDVDVSDATDPLNKYYFRLTVDGVESHSNIWAHGADARTYFPEQDMPSGVGACN